MLISQKMKCRHHSKFIISSLRLEAQNTRNIIEYANPRQRYIRASGFSSKSKDTESGAVEHEKRMQSDPNRKVLITTVTKKLMNSIIRRNLSVSGLSNELKNIESNAVEKKIMVSMKERVIKIIGYISNTTGYIIRVSSVLWKSENTKSEDEKDERKIQFNAFRKKFEVATEEKITNIKRYIDPKMHYIRTLGLSDKPEIGESKAARDEQKIYTNTDRKLLKTVVKEKIMIIVGYVNSMRKDITALGLFNKSNHAESEAVENKKEVQFADKKIFEAAVREIVIKLNTEELRKIKGRHREYNVEQYSTKIRQNKVETWKEKDESAADVEVDIAKLDFLVNPADLESLPKTNGRSPNEYEPLITVYWRKDVEAKALKTCGSREALLRKLLKMELEQKMDKQNARTKKTHNKREKGDQTESSYENDTFNISGMLEHQSTIINGSKFLIKHFVLLYFGPYSVYSAADICNQFILAYSIEKGLQAVKKFDRNMVSDYIHADGAGNTFCRGQLRTDCECMKENEKRQRRYCEYCGRALFGTGNN